MKKYIFTLLLAIAGAITAWAEDVETCVVVEFKSGETLTIALSEKPTAQFEGNDLLLSSEKFEGRYATTDIQRFRFEDVASGIHAIEAVGSVSEGIIYDLEGRQVATYKGTIDSTTLPTGVYVVKTQGGKAFKVTKK